MTQDPVKVAVLLLLSLLISACANVPASIQSENVATVNANIVQGQMDRYQGQSVRWGGVITQVINHANETWIEVLSLDLQTSGRPVSDREQNHGRFIAKMDEFLDPEVYQEGYSFTVVGVLTEGIDGKIGDYNYTFPVVTAHGHHLWPKKSYRYYPPIMPGYWYYGFHPYWRFGYGYYGYGVRIVGEYYPYYPVFGHLDRRTKSVSNRYRSGRFEPRKEVLWPITTGDIQTSWRRIVGSSNPRYRTTNPATSNYSRARNTIHRNTNAMGSNRQRRHSSSDSTPKVSNQKRKAKIK